MPFRYSKVLIFGATSGIGRALAAKIVAEGSSVIAVGRRKEHLDAFAHEHGGGGKVGTAVFDITDFQQIPAFVQATTSKHPDLDCVVFNSGMQRHLNWADPAAIDMGLVETEFATNYTAYLHLTKAILPFAQQRAPTAEVALVYVTSGLALAPIAYCSNYCASKAALHHMVLALRMQMRDMGSRVKIVELLPPAVQTELHDDKHQPEFQGRGGALGMPLDAFTEEAYAGLNADDNEHVPVQMVKDTFGYYGWEQERQKVMWKMDDMRKSQAH